MSNWSLESHAPLPFRAAPVRAVSTTIRQLFGYVAHRHQIRQDTKRLELDDRALADIGVSRGEIMYAMRTGACRRARTAACSAPVSELNLLFLT
ncbi:DUF1127 domain-containing protein [Rhizobium sp. LjRoot258]|uniref:DUF1127 domain-containing protein n=1 Tax=Rhizobium sp. LjRoot258 TaxID=3342299 RepID=UPI003ECF322A